MINATLRGKYIWQVIEKCISVIYWFLIRERNMEGIRYLFIKMALLCSARVALIQIFYRDNRYHITV